MSQLDYMDGYKAGKREMERRVAELEAELFKMRGHIAEAQEAQSKVEGSAR